MATPASKLIRRLTLRDRVAALLHDEDQVTAEQRLAVFHPGNFLLEACPGSGKTRTIGLRAAWASVDGAHRIVAATSYTNVAVEEIQQAAAAASSPISEPHFVGTLHNFLLRYVFYPFGRLVMGCTDSPRVAFRRYSRSEAERVLVGGGRHRIPIPLSTFEFTADGRLAAVRLPPGVTLSPEEVTRQGYQQAIRLKAQLAAQGLATPNDSLHYVRLVLERYPEIAAGVAARFGELIVDEAQDTNDIQLRCVRLLQATGTLQSLVLVGDFDQAIYSFSRADPKQCRAFARQCRLETLHLTHNFRSSQEICNVTYRFSTRPRPDAALGPHRAFGVRPEVLRYNPRELEQLRAAFRHRLISLDIAPKDARILVRTSSFADRLNGVPARQDSPAVRVLGAAAMELDNGVRPGIVMVGTTEHLLATFAWGDDFRQQMNYIERRKLRQQTITLLGSLPPLDQSLNDWIAQARVAVLSALQPLTDNPVIAPGRRIRSVAREDRRSARLAFADTLPADMQAHTVHSAKGESYDGILLVADAPRGDRDHARAWIASAQTESVAEEIRVAYVALTRARRYLAVALPEACPNEIVSLYLDRGFRSHS